jgi:hypothetical protein
MGLDWIISICITIVLIVTTLITCSIYKSWKRNVIEQYLGIYKDINKNLVKRIKYLEKLLEKNN